MRATILLALVLASSCALTGSVTLAPIQPAHYLTTDVHSCGDAPARDEVVCVDDKCHPVVGLCREGGR